MSNVQALLLSVLSVIIGLTTWGLSPDTVSAEDKALPKIYQVLPKDAISAILKPEFVPATTARVADEAAMIGVVINGEAHAYSSVVLNTHEIVNDVVGGVKIATTW